jgi:hypothetical protein
MPPINYQSAGYDFSLLNSGTYNADTAAQTKSKATTSQNDEFKSVFSPSLTMSDSALNTGRLVGRNASLSQLSEQITQANAGQQNASNATAETNTRQGEINEWEAQNKLDTLFFLQILFLYFSAVVILLYLRQGKILGSTSVYGGIVGLLVIVIGILWNRVSYTNMSRDSRYWNRRYIASNPNGLLSANQCSY